jgi:hypothetical protein
MARPLRLVAFFLVAFMTSASVRAQFGPEPPPRPAGDAAHDPAAIAARKTYDENLARYRGNPDYLVLPGLLANKKEKWVRLAAKATGITPNDPLEFWLIPPDAGKEYEALAVGLVKPSDVHKALEFIGMRAGRPVDPMANQYWPKGERVFMTFHWDDPPAKEGEKPTPRQARAEQLVIDVRTKKPLPSEGLVFTGSYIIPSEDGGPDRYAAEAIDPHSIAADFNCRASVLDVPRQAVQGDNYGLQKLNPEYHLAANQPMAVMLEPEYRDGRKRVCDLSLTVSLPPGVANIQAGRFVLADARGKTLNAQPTLIHALAEFDRLTESGRDPFVTLHVDDQLTLASVRELYTLLSQLDNEKGIRIDAPPPGQLYYRAFFPREQWRDRKKRLGRPWELHLALKDQALAATLILPADEIDDNNGLGDLSFEIHTPQELAQTLVEKSDRFSRVVYIFAPADLKYGQLMGLIRPALTTHPMMYVFPPP